MSTDVTTSTELQVDPALRAFVADELLPGLDLDPDWFWSTVAALQERFGGRIAELLARRDELQARIDAWHREHGAGTVEEYEAFLTEIGYLLPLGEPAVRVSASTRRSPRFPARSSSSPRPCRDTRSTPPTPAGARCSTPSTARTPSRWTASSPPATTRSAARR